MASAERAGLVFKRTSESTQLLESDPDWAFWRDWYQGWLTGNHIDWEIQRRVALIEEPIWEAGPTAVAAEIEKIRAAFDVEKGARDLEQAAALSPEAQRGIGDNKPPGPIDDLPNTANEVTVIWAVAQELEAQAKLGKPDRSRVVRARDALVLVLKNCGLWMAKKIDLAIDMSIKTTVPTAVGAGALWITNNQDKLWTLWEAVERWLSLMP